ncbi:MAG: NAD(P)/FAD-dependent oxidoreductase [Gammaproteobacteria bacterium]|nr:NAD(P)/FAD-dependent oxidoreductase [Gammaproteobacteria bacterium]NIR85873.1 NAD(P)/FAD-dependent oxidoreductase [Gammaproteobacteria bacterium]NIU07036.1 NAD(P)/FAD-dependent oxidoreductase [Gammaproteobacteria bacterium]NIV53947.1 FAD-dependent oxidoreductase [Gammaproteobacteria bacterium]NIX88309.1 FAD-dependent oxidoreductase [Gammaproteobacteria bacterium]
MTEQATFDLIVIGSGPGGYKAAVAAAHLGARVALIERDRPGGTCLNEGCIPKKSLLYLAGLIEDVNVLNGWGLVGNISGDYRAALTHKDQVVATIGKNFPVWLKQLGIRVYFGHARLRGPREVEISTREGPVRLRSGRLVIATGAEPRPHSACPIDGDRVQSSREFMADQRAMPASFLFVGGGAVGSELAYLAHQFGARVTVAEQSGRLLNKPCIPERASDILERKFERIGIEVRKGATVKRLRHLDDEVEVELTDGGHGRYGRVLVAIGRKPHTEGLDLGRAGIATDPSGFIITNEYLETAASGVYAVGDVKFGPMTANGALHDAKIAATNAVEGNRLRYNYNRVPIVIDSALEIAAVGLTEDRAEDAGFEPEAARTSFSGSPKARGRNDYEGFIEVVHDEETGQLLGGCIVGAEAGEQIQMLTAACQSTRGLWFLKDINYSHPSWCEELENAIDRYTAAFTQSGKEVFRPGIYAIDDSVARG